MPLVTALKTTALCLFVALAGGVLTADAAQAQSGKLSGRVTDARTGEGIPGVNILILESTRGGTTNAEGYYTILNAPVGSGRSVRFSFIGYTTQVIENVALSIGQTTTLDVQLQEETADIGEVTVVAVRPVVEADVSNSRANIGATEIEALPAASVTSVVGLQAGIQGLSVRGSGSDEVSFQVNGLTLRDERDNSPYTNISLASVEEVQVQTGGFNAEYGNVRSGVVNVITKEGSTRAYEADAIVRLSPAAQKHFGQLANDPDAYWIRPFIDPAVAFEGTTAGGWDLITQRSYPTFQGWNAVAAARLANDNPADDMTPLALQQAFLWQHRKVMDITEPDYDVDLGFGGPVPGVSRLLGNLRFYASYRRARDMYMLPLHTDQYADDSGHLKLTSDLAPSMKLSVEGRIGGQSGTAASRSGQPGFFRSPSGIASNLTNVSFIDSRIFSGDYWNPSTVRYNQVGATFTHSPTARSFYQVRLNRFDSQYDSNPGPRRNTSPVVSFGGVGFDEGPFGWQPFPSDGVDGMRMGVGMSNSRDSSRVSVYNLAADYTAQLNRFMEIKTGFEYNLTRSRINYAQVDSFLTSGNFRVLWDRSPVRAATYGQTKLEFQGMIANVGLRMDYAHAGGEWYEFELYDQVFAGVPLIGGDPQPGLSDLLVTAPTKRIVTLSPRLGVSFPVTNISKLYFNYGHFRSMPSPDDLYLVRAFAATGRISRIANPNNPLPLTVAYELGYEQSFADQYLARVAGYYKDVSLEPRTVTYNNRSGSVTYALSEPNSYADIRGFELTLSKTRGRFFQGFVNYTYMVTTSGYFGLPSIFENTTIQQQQEESDALRRNASSRPIPRPYGRINLDFFSPKDFGPSLAGLQPLADWRASVIGRWQDGGRFSWGDNGVPLPGVVNNVDIADFWTIDLRFSRRFRLAGRDATFFADVFNATNRKSLSLFYGAVDGNDRNAYLSSLHFPESDEYSNIPGSDRVGTFRPDDVAFQPICSVSSRDAALSECRVGGLGLPALSEDVIYYERASESYVVYRNGDWQAADPARIREVLDTKAYIDMPNQRFLNFLSPRDVFVGVRINL